MIIDNTNSQITISADGTIIIKSDQPIKLTAGKDLKVKRSRKGFKVEILSEDLVLEKPVLI